MALHRSQLAVVAIALGITVAKEELIQGVCYGPFPSKTAVVQETQLLDDFMSDVAKPLWGPHGRGDLRIIRQLGANTVRMYGNDPKQHHASFLAEALKEGLKVVPGISDWPYLQSPDSCKNTDFDCYSQVKETYGANLRTGFLQDGAYHPAIRHVIVINEPDLKLKNIGEIMSPEAFAKGIISAVDGMLDAEKEAGVTGNLVKFTATFSFGLCLSCSIKAKGDPNGKPAVNQMLVLRDAFMHPSRYGYAPKNDLKQFYENRFLNSFNTANSADEIPRLFLESYEQDFPMTSVVIEEFHSVQRPLDQQVEVSTILDLARKSKVLLGISFFEFQVRYDKGGTEMAFGMFGLGDYKITTLQYFDLEYNVWCLKPVEENLPQGTTIPSALQAAFGGTGVDYAQLCMPDAATVPLDRSGFDDIRGEPTHVAVFVSRVVDHMGGEVTDQNELSKYAKQVDSFDTLVRDLYAQKPSWARWDPLAACVGDRRADADSVGKAIAAACEETEFNCADIPVQCKGTVWHKADYVFSTVYTMKQGNPMKSCHRGGSATFARSSLYHAEDSYCVVTKDPATTPLSDQGYQAIVTQKSTQKTAVFFRRVIMAEFGARVADPEQLLGFAAQPPGSMYDVRRLLKGAQWLCGGTTGRGCLHEHAGGGEQLWWWRWAFAGLGAVALLGTMCTIVYVKMQKTWDRMERSFTPYFPGCEPDSDEDSSD